ncbi:MULTISPECIES: GNAT family N-acetyltransferase [Lentzea]|uniref:GNAT family N-acetyltransferase n=1 Tax=Lentzea TaxID=165301 RepID=UPI003898F53D
MARIITLAISPRHQRRGVGKLLLQAGEEWARDEPHQVVVLSSSSITCTGSDGFEAAATSGSGSRTRRSYAFAGRSRRDASASRTELSACVVRRNKATGDVRGLCATKTSG